MPATEFKIDISLPGSGVSITPTDPETQHVVRDGDMKDEDLERTWKDHYLRRGSRVVETIVLNTGNGTETYFVMTKLDF